MIQRANGLEVLNGHNLLALRVYPRNSSRQPGHHLIVDGAQFTSDRSDRVRTPWDLRDHVNDTANLHLRRVRQTDYALIHANPSADHGLDPINRHDSAV